MDPLFLAIGLVAGVLSGLFGIGGGILIIPALIFFAAFHTKLAIGTSLGAMLLPVGLLGAYAYYQAGNLHIKASLLIALGLFCSVCSPCSSSSWRSGSGLKRVNDRMTSPEAGTPQIQLTSPAFAYGEKIPV